MAKIIIDVCWENKKFVEEIIKENYEQGSMLDMEIRMGLKEAVVVSSEQEIINTYLDKIRAEIELQRKEVSKKHSEHEGLSNYYFGLNDGLKDARDIIDKYNAESEDKE